VRASLVRAERRGEALMWLFTPFGFFSAVAHRERDDMLCVRARARRDLEALNRRMAAKHRIVDTPDADYPYRILVTRGAFSDFLDSFVKARLTYDNFKAAAGRDPSETFKHQEVLHDVWATMHKHEDQRARLGRRLPHTSRR
jgi:hypothetical protein